ncbi:MAG: FixH family protein [Burkholderiaceae bacterium]
MSHPASSPLPWYRHRWPWLLMLAPGAAAIGGFFILWLAASANNSLVVDDYYREGRAINLQLARDRLAGELGLHGELSGSTDADGAAVVLQLQARPGIDWPDTLTLSLVHATRAELDASWPMQRIGEGRYRAAATLPASGHWQVQIEDPARRWRLVNPRVGSFAQPVPFGQPR